MPFEVEKVHALAEGFELIFTEPVDPNTAIDPRRYAISQFNYRHHATYGSSIFNHQGVPDEETELPVPALKFRMMENAWPWKLQICGPDSLQG